MLQILENLNKKREWKHFYANFHELYEEAIKATNMLQLYTAYFNLFKMVVQYQFFPILMVLMLFP